MENQALWHERDISHSSVERVIMPDSTILMDYVLHRLCNLLENLRVIPENMDRNLMSSYGLFFSQRVLTALVESGMARQEAYVMVQKAAMKSWDTGTSFPENVRADADITAHLQPEVLDALFDAGYYLRHEDMIFDRVFAG
jgi:adenylosuccinate lyase